jgi:hypothetical protein
MRIKKSLKTLFVKVNRLVSEDMTDFDPGADYDTRVKLPEWQLARLKKRKNPKTAR